MKFQSQKGNIVVRIIVIILAILIVAGIWRFYKFGSVIEQTAEPLSGEDTTTAIQNDFDAIDFGADLEKEMDQQLNADINSL